MARLSVLLSRSLLPLAAVGALLSGCSPAYVVEAAYTHSKILLGRKRIDRLIADPATPSDERAKLETVLAARRFAQLMGLDPGESFTKYARVDGDVLAWIVAGAKPDAFELHTWWFPIVGTVPYKGYFDRAAAESEAARLERRGYETWVRGTEAFSTLGWFNDPVLSTTLRHDHTSIANTVIHESVHTTVWIPNHVDFNESLANFVGVRGALDFARSLIPPSAERTSAAEIALTRELEIGDAVMRMYAALDALYKSTASREEKLATRAAIFEREMAPVRATYPTLKILKSINNAEIIQLKLYLTALPDFAALFEQSGGDWSRFFGKIREIRDRVDTDAATDPFAVLKQLAAS
jgi:predicted aminopeptidase